jgi:hypothetical protein
MLLLIPLSRLNHTNYLLNYLVPEPDGTRDFKTRAQFILNNYNYFYQINYFDIVYIYS